MARTTNPPTLNDGCALEQLALFADPAPPDPTREHEAQFPAAVLAAFGPLIPPGTWVHDPFAGTGYRLGQLADVRGWIFTGTELEAEFIADRRVRQGNALDRATYPTAEHVIVTSPVYPNGMADHFVASDPTDRHTYRQSLHRLNGYDRPLHPDNMGRFNLRRGTRIAGEYWRRAGLAVTWWTAPTVFVNMKDVVVAGRVVAIVEEWAGLLERHGYRVVERIRVNCPGNRHGANGAARVDHEMVLVAKRGGGS